MRRVHSMPFGAEPVGGGVRFRLWAPAAGDVRLHLGDGTEHLMERVDDGFFELTTDAASAGTRYGFRVDDHELVVPDPASRSNPEDVHALSEVVDPGSFDWRDGDWRGRPWNEAVIYELHTGTFTGSGDFDGVIEKLPYLKSLGITALELMPVAEFPGGRGWGYDGVLMYAPESAYGGPAALKRLVQAAHAEGLMVFLDVVYNHFGPDGNYLHLYSPQFFTDRIDTPWGQAIDFDGPASRAVREFYIHNTLYWLEEFNLDGFRYDAVHAIHDRSDPDILEELAERVRERTPEGRHVHLVLENDDNAARYMRSATGAGPRRFDAQWNDDIHHALHVALTGEAHGYYADYSDDPIDHLGRCLSEGFAYQGERSEYRDRARGERSADLPSSAFVSFTQNHDQVGNRALGDRLTEQAPPEALAAAEALLLLAPQPPLLFMGQEYDAGTRFPYFSEYGGELGKAVTEGRRREFSRFPQFSDPEMLQRIPDPNDPATFEAARLDWGETDSGGHRQTLERHRRLLSLRHEHLVPRLPAVRGAAEKLAPRMLKLRWELEDGSRWHLLANLGGRRSTMPAPGGQAVYAVAAAAEDERLTLSDWAVAVFLEH